MSRAKAVKMTASKADGVEYRRAKTWQIALGMLPSAASMCFYMLMTYATYIGNAGFGVLVAVTGIIMTVSRVFDGITDPIIAFVMERFNSKHGKVRIFMMIGWAIMSISTTAMCTWGAGHLSGAAGLVFFIFFYMLYIIGYTFAGIATSVVGNIMTDDPKQRPTLSVWSTIYGYLCPMILSIVSMAVLLPMYDNVIDTPFLSAYNAVVVFLSLALYLLSCIGIAPYDKPENFESVSVGKSSDAKPSTKDMWDLIKNNKELQRFMVSAISDKLAQTIGSVSVITVMLYGIMIGNMSISTVISTVAMLPSIVFAIIGAHLAGKYGNKKVMVDWTWACLVLNVLYGAFLLFTDTTQITKSFLPTAIFFIFTFANSAFKMIVSAATGALRMDIVDYEFYRSGKYMPATVGATHSFLDKLVSALGPAIATLLISFIGYRDVTPQQGDPLTTGVKVMTVAILCFFPIIGWICTIVAMRKSELTKEKMVEVQRVNNERRKEEENKQEEAKVVEEAVEDVEGVMEG